MPDTRVTDTRHVEDTIGFIGLGVMGEPMARNLLRAGTPLIVWNRTAARAESVGAAGAVVAGSVAEVFERAAIVLMMLLSGETMDAVLGRGTPGFAAMVRGRTIVNMATTSPDYSQQLAADLADAGARYVEAPVSGQRPIAEAGTLVAMVAGDADAVAAVRPVLAPMCSSVVACGAVPNGLRMKLAVNLVSGTIMTSLAEGANYARQLDLDVGIFAAVLLESSLASTFLRMKLPKLAAQDFSVQGAIGVGRKDLDMMRDEADAAGASIPLLETCATLWDEAIALGHGEQDVSVVLRAFEARARELEG